MAAVIGGWTKPQTRIRPGVAGLRRGGDVSDRFGGVETASAAARTDRVRADGGNGCIDGVAGNQAERADYGAGCLGRRFWRRPSWYQTAAAIICVVFLPFLLNAGVAAIAWFKAWRPLNLTGFAGTFSIAALWGMQSYTPQHFAMTEPFLIYHWLLYTFIAYLFARRKLTENREDTSRPLPTMRRWKKFGTASAPTACASTSSTILLLFGHDGGGVRAAIPYGRTLAVCGRILRAGLRRRLRACRADAGNGNRVYISCVRRLLPCRCFSLTLAVPLYFERGNTVILWTVESALVYFFGRCQQRPHMRLGALVVYLLAALTQLSGYQEGESTILHGQWFTTPANPVRRRGNLPAMASLPP